MPSPFSPLFKNYPAPVPMPWALIAACCFGMFAATASGSSRAPFLLDMAADLDVSLPAIANLFGVTSVAWGISSYVAGLSSDRLGRRVFLLGAPVALALSLTAVSLAQSYLSLVIFVAIGGVACGSFTATAMAEVSLRVANHQRGQALGWVMTGQSLTLLIGVPLAAWTGAAVGWRGVHLAIGGLALTAALAMALTVRPGATNSATRRGTKPPSLKGALPGPVIRLLVAMVMERVCFGLAAFYYPAFLRTAYDLAIDQVALPLVGFALGNIVGTILGGQLADRFPYRRISFAATLCVAGAFALAWFTWPVSLALTVALGVCFSLFDALSRPPLMAALADVPADVRGLIMGLNSTVASVGWMTAALVGGWLYAGVGFAAFGPLALILSLLGAAIVVPDSRLRQRR